VKVPASLRVPNPALSGQLQALWQRLQIQLQVARRRSLRRSPPA
jgi:hypothetical protein